MDQETIRQKTEVLYKHHSGSNEAIVFIHGILEGPKQFRQLAEIAYEQGYSFYMIVLPGHGGSSHKFATTYYMEWVKYVSRHITLLLLKYEQIIIVGHSMGALLAICESAVRKKGIKALFLIDPPLKIHLWPRVIKGAIKIYLNKISRDDLYTLAEYHAMNVGPITIKSFIGWLSRYSELISIISYSKMQISKLEIPIYLVFAAKDEFVSIESQKYFKGYRGKIQLLHLRDSGHFCYHHSDLVQLEKAYTDFIKMK